MKNKKIGLIICDGLGWSKNKKENAFYLAKHPYIDKLLDTCPYSILQASELAVGLPKGQMGNSEIGHLNIGAGRGVKSELVRINEAVETGNMVSNENLLKAIEIAKQANTKFHIIGLTSTGGVHSQLNQILEVLTICGKAKVNTVLHCITDGRDTPTNAFIKDLKAICKLIDSYDSIQLGTIGGRYYGMDRNQNWDRIQKHIDALVGKSISFTDPHKYISDSYEQNITDEFIVPAKNAMGTNIKLDKNDVVFFANFRPDRARQLCHCIKKSKLYKQTSELWDLNLTLVTMVKYDGIDSDIILYPPEDYDNTLGKVLANNNLKQLRIAETEKYAHVTFFLDGGKEVDYKNETKILVPSPSVATYDLQPEMSAYKITDKLLANIDKFDVIICNFANCDMVGHTGDMKATIRAVETVDECLGKIVAKAKQIGMTLFITADHGNCDQMILDNKPCTTHSLAPVFFISTDTNLKLKDGSLGNIAPTILKYLDIDKPIQMDKEALY